MKNNLDIEDLFKNSFDGYKTNPGNDVWKGINRQLWKRSFGAFFKASFDGYKVEPASLVWKNIVRKLWFYNFVRFNVASFNIYYFGLALSIITATIALNSGNNKTSIQSSYQNTPQIIFHDNIVQNPVAVNTSDAEKVKYSVETGTNLSNDKQKNTLTQKPIQNKNNQEQVFTKKGNKKQQDYKVIANNANSTATAQIFTNKAIQQQNKKNEPVLVAQANPSADSKNQITEMALNSKPVFTLLQPKSSLLALSLPQNNLSPDTVGYNFFGTPIVFERTHWSVDAWFAPMLNRSTFGTKNLENKPYADDLNKRVSDVVTYENVGADFNFSYKNWAFQIGASYMEFGQKMNVTNTVTGFIAKPVYSYMETHRLMSDTVWFINLDSLMHSGDTIWVPEIVKQYWVVKKDSIKGTAYDTLKTKSNHLIANRYSYFEIPLMAGYEIQHNKFSYTIKGGVAAGFFIKSAGRLPMYSSEDSYDLGKNNLPYIKPNFSLLLSIRLDYHLSNKFTIFGEPYIRKNINSIFQNGYKVSQTFQSTGVKFGIRYLLK